jgi:Glycine zipper
MKKIISVLGLAFALAAVSTGAQAQTTSHKKKDAIVGGVAGAATGAVVSKKRGKGAIIGGALGAGAGYAVGRHKDKKAGKKD